MRKKSTDKEEVAEEEVIKNMVNFHKEYSKGEQDQILATNAHGMSRKAVERIFLGSFPGRHRHTNKRDVNALALSLLWVQGWDFQTLLGMLERLNSSDTTIDLNMLGLKAG